MMKSLRLQASLLAAGFGLLGLRASAQPYTENFDNISLLTGSGWLIQNNSAPLGANSWFQGTATSATPQPGPFNAYNGADNAYIAANYACTGNLGTISSWLITPNRTFRNGDVFQFYTRKPTVGPGQTDYPDRLEVRLSTNGASTNVGTSATSVGDFSTLLLSINSLLVANVYPQTWSQYTITISGLPAPTSGRIAFRYFVTNGGLTGSNSDYIGIDNVVYMPYVCPTLTVDPTTLPAGSAGSAYSQSLSQTGALGSPGYAITAGALPPGLTLSAGGTISGTPTATGTFNFTVTVSDASGCSGSRPYSITMICPANPISFPVPEAVCSNVSSVDLGTFASPAGGSYSGTGVSGDQFDPAAGTQDITYDLTDPYGCAHSRTQTLTVNTAPVASQTAVGALCSNQPALTLSGGSPAGGTYSGTGVTGGQFDPAAGTQTLTYTYTDANGCSDDVTFDVTVNAAPTVTQSTVNPVCGNDAVFELSGGSPAGGVYSGTGVSGGEFDPAAGTQTLTYTYTDANGCTEEAAFDVTVNTPPSVSHAAVNPICSNLAPVTLTGATPAGGTYSGTGISGDTFNPSVGTQTITYGYTDANGCSDETTFDITVNTAPDVTQSAINAVCSNAAPVALSGGLPAGGTYSGTGVSGSQFDPAAGTQTLSYAYTDANNCSDTITFDVTVNTAPVVTQSAVGPFCSDQSPVTLTGGLPAGGTYSGTGVSGGAFNPAAGAQTLTYTYTDGNGCSDAETFSVSVNAAPNVSFTLPATVCVNASPVSLNGLPAGGTYTGTGVSGGQFNPAVAGVGNITVTYSYTDGSTGCSKAVNATVAVSACAGIAENSLDGNLAAYPNPSTGMFTLAFTGVNGNLQLEVLDMQGKRIYNSRLAATDTFTHTLDLTAFANGIYYLKATAQGQSAVLKLIKQD